MRYCVQLEELVRIERIVEAESYEDAVDKACAVTADPATCKNLQPRWVDTEEHVLGAGELRFEVVGHCETCHKPIVPREDDSQPWSYTCDNYGNMICYACAQLQNKAAR